MADTTFVNYSTVVPAAWLNDVNDLAYSGQFPLTTQTWAIGTIPLTYASQGVSGYIYNSANTGSVDSNALLRIHSVNRNANVQVIGGAANEGGFQALSQAGVFAGGMSYFYSSGDWVWKTTPGGIATDQLRLTQAGLLGLGTASPFLKFTAANSTTDGVWAGSSGSVSILGFGGYGNAGDGAFQFHYNRGTGTCDIRQGTRDTPVTVASISNTGAFSIVASAGTMGYGTGSGGAVTQLTNKSTAVTLNKGTGTITMNNAALAAGATAFFAVNNSLVAANDVIAINIQGIGAAYSYTASVYFTAAGSFNIAVTNITGGSLSEAPTIKFAVIKGATA